MKTAEDRMQDVKESGAVQLLTDTIQPILRYLEKVEPEKDGRLTHETVAVLGGITHAFIDLLYEAVSDTVLAKKMVDYIVDEAHKERLTEEKADA